MQLGNPNHSAIHSTVFMADPTRYPAHRRNNRSPEEVAALRDTMRARLESEIARAAGRDLVTSGEDTVLLDTEALTAMRDFFTPHFDAIEIIGYVRAPASYMASALQQRLVGGQNAQFRTLYPNYRERFEKFDTVFGRDRVTLVKFDRTTLTGGDVIADFGGRIGAVLPPEEAAEANVGRSLEAAALLFAHRRFGEPVRNYPGAPRDNQKMVEHLSQIGAGKIRLHRDAVAPMIEANAGDIAWMEGRLGTSLAETLSVDDDALRDPDDLLPIAGRSLAALGEAIAAALRAADPDPQLAARGIDFLLAAVGGAGAQRREARGGEDPEAAAAARAARRNARALREAGAGPGPKAASAKAAAAKAAGAKGGGPRPGRAGAGAGAGAAGAAAAARRAGAKAGKGKA
jgi:hypothetical protein